MFAAFILPYVLSFLGKLTLKEIMYIIVVAVIGIAAGYLWYKGDQHGKQVIQQQIEQQNERAAKEAADAARSVDECYAAGVQFTWNQSTGKCERGM